MSNKANYVVEAFNVSINDYADGVLGVSATVNFYKLLCTYKTVHKKQLDEEHLKMLDDTIQKAMDAMDAAFANE